jgi:hypothetical protein
MAAYYFNAPARRQVNDSIFRSARLGGAREVCTHTAADGVG